MLIDSLELNRENLCQTFCRYCNSFPDAKIIIFGAGSIGKMTHDVLVSHGYKVDSFCDNDINKQGTYIRGLKVISFDQLVNLDGNVQVILNDKYYIEKMSQLESAHFPINHTWRFEAYSFFFKQFTTDYLIEHIDDFEKTFALMNDSKSKYVLEGYINGSLTGDISFFENIMSPDKQYFPMDIRCDNNEYNPFDPSFAQHIFVDVGSCDGMSSCDFIEYFHHAYRRIYAIEPMKESVKIIKEKKIPKMIVYNIAVTDIKGSKQFYISELDSLRMAASIPLVKSSQGKQSFYVDTIDNILLGNPVTYMKMDIEGNELLALHGAKKTIQINKPLLAIAVDHKRDDLITIVSLLHDFVPEYKFYLRHHTHMSFDLVLYAVAW